MAVLQMNSLVYDKIYNIDCLEGMSMLPNSSIDMILCDLPYGITDFAWDSVIPFDKLWKEYRRVTRKNGRIVLFGVQPFTADLIRSNSIDFSHMLYWKKNTKTRAMNADGMPTRSVEEIAVFNCSLNTGEHLDLREYMINELRETGVSYRDVDKVFKNGGAHHWFRDCSDFRIPTRENYEKLQKTGRFGRPYESIRREYDSVNRSPTYNKPEPNNDVLEFKSLTNNTRIHPTQKPVELCEHLIRVYSNENDVILDNCIGSGTTAIAAVRTGRRYIGFEKDADYFKLAQEWIDRENESMCLAQA